MDTRTETLNDIKAKFYDFQRHQANEFEKLVSEVVSLNKRPAEVGVVPHSASKEKASKA